MRTSAPRSTRWLRKALETVLSKSPEAKALYGKAVGHAAFENLKIAIGISGGGGTVSRCEIRQPHLHEDGHRGGGGSGSGGQKYQVVFLSRRAGVQEPFVDKGWAADASAQAAAADKGADAAGTFKNGSRSTSSPTKG